MRKRLRIVELFVAPATIIGVVLLAGSAAAPAQDKANAAVDAIFADLTKQGSPGCALGVYRDGKIAYAKGYGLADIEGGVPIAPQSVFDIGSTSKQFTASSILLLEKQHKLRLDDDIHTYIPELPDYGHKITILHLLNHTSGVRDYLSLFSLAGVNLDGVTTDDDGLAIIARQKALNFPPGSDFLYSNSGFFLLSVIVKRVSGKTLREFAVENIFQALGMTHTTYRDDHTMLIPNRALAYALGEKGSYKLRVSYFEQLGDGAVHTSVEDLQKWDENFYSAQLGGKDFLGEIQEQGKLSSGKTLEYAKGLVIGEHRGLHTVRHGGAWGGYRAELLRFPEQHFSVACLCNVGNANPERRANEVAEIYLGGIMKPKESVAAGSVPNTPSGVSLSDEQLRPLVGTYRNSAKGTIARTSIKEGKLHLGIYGQSVGLRAVNATEFVPVTILVDAKINFEAPASGKSRLMKISGEGPLAGTFEAIAPSTPSAADLAVYAGSYASDELGVVYRLVVTDGKLRLAAISDIAGFPRAASLPLTELQPTIADGFELNSTPVTLQFSRGVGGTVTGFTLDAGRTRGMLFTRTSQTERVAR